MSLSRFFAATLPTGISVIITTIYLIATGQKFFNQKDSVITNGYKLCTNTQTLFIGVGSSFFLPPSFNEDLTFSVWDVILYGIIIDLFWYCSHRHSIRTNGFIKTSINSIINLSQQDL